MRRRGRLTGPNCVNNGHPEDKYGWALAGGAKFNLAGGDMVGFNVCYSKGAAGRCTNENGWLLYNNCNSVGVGWLSDGVFGTGTQMELTRAWSALAAYEHFWNPKWRTAVGGGYVDVNYNDAATKLHLRALRAAAAACGVPVGVEAQPSPPSRSVRAAAAIPTTASGRLIPGTQWNPVPQLDIGLQVMYTHHNTAFKGPATIAANGSRPAVVNGIIDDQNVWSAMFRWQRNFYP